MSKSLPLVLLFLLAACSGSTVITSAATDAGTPPGDDADADATMTPDAATPYGQTKAGQSCDPGMFPPATSCSIPGTYDVVESDCTSGCGAHPDFSWTASVTLSGTTVKLTNGSNRVMHCELTTDCDCVASGGDRFRFTSAGFVSTGKGECGTAMMYYLATGTKQ